MDTVFILTILVIICVSIFDFTNGFHDASDMVATPIASRAMTPAVAIMIVTFFTFIAPFVVGLSVADTIGTFIDVTHTNTSSGVIIVLSAILSAISFNIITWKLGLPSSSSNSLVGGLIGAGLISVGHTSINWGVEALLDGRLDGLIKIIAGLFFSPLAGFLVGFLLFRLFLKLFARLTLSSQKFFIISQYVATSWLGFSHGANDAQKGMAIIAMVLLASKETSEFVVPFWVILLCTASITAGTLFGGWSIIKTLGFGIIKVKTIHSFTDQIGSALINSIATSIGAPTSTTQVVTATLMGIGAGEKPKHVKWSVANSIIKSWFFNIPICMLIGAFFYFIISGVL